MADFADLGSAREQQDLELALQKRKPEGPPATGFCLYCHELLCADLRWCDAECRDAWQADQRRGV